MFAYEMNGKDYNIQLQEKNVNFLEFHDALH